MKFHKYETLTEKANSQCEGEYTPEEIFEAALLVAEKMPRGDTQAQLVRAGLEMLWQSMGGLRVNLSKEHMDALVNQRIEDQLFGDLGWPIDGVPLLVCVEEGRPYGVQAMLCARLEDRFAMHIISKTGEFTGEYVDCWNASVQATAELQSDKANSPYGLIAILEAHKLLQVVAAGVVGW